MHPRPVVIVLLTLVLVGLLAGSPFAARSQESTPTADLEANKALALRWHNELFEEGNLDVADEILALDFVWYNPPTEVFLSGPEAVKQQSTDFRGFFPDYVLTNDDVIAEGDRVVIRWTMQGTVQAEAGPLDVTYTGIDIFRIEDGKIVELWQNTDDLGLEEQFNAGMAMATPATGTPSS
jgi:predicted SnoaL-like aldol condensation-catalyzing enzyme